MKKNKFFYKLKNDGLIAVIRGSSELEALKCAEACCNGGVRFIEITFTIPKAHVILAKVSKEYERSNIIVGAGTVLDMHTSRAAILSGAKFIVAPTLDFDSIACCNRYGVPIIPGVGSATEALKAMEAGADVLKLFPGNVFKPEGLKALKGPLPQAEFIPTGGVDLDNIADWLSAGAFALGVGGNITAGAKKGDYAAVEQAAQAFRMRIDEILAKRGGDNA